MRIRSKTGDPYRTEQLQRIPVDEEFPVGVPDFNTRDDSPDIGPHIHDLLEIGYCFDGSGLFLIGGKIFSFKTGDAVVINTHEVHVAYGSPGRTTSWGFLHLDPVRLLANNVGSYSESLKWSQYCGAAFRNIIDGGEYPEITDCIRRILFEVRDRPENYRVMVRSLIWQLLLLLNRYYHAGKTADTPRDYHDIERVVPALRYLNDHYHEEVPITQLARLCFTSESNFRKLFHRALGCAPQPYLLRLRLNTACALLKNSDTPILEIAQHCGYRNLSNFNRQFKECFGISPREWRREGNAPGALPNGMERAVPLP